MMRDQNQPCVLALEKRLVENGKKLSIEKFYEKERDIRNFRKPEIKTRICREENFWVEYYLFTCLHTDSTLVS